jgi:hypothetical protein
MFKLTCGDSWVDELPSINEDGSTNIGVAFFIMSYIVIAVWTILQVSIELSKAHPLSLPHSPPPQLFLCIYICVYTYVHFCRLKNAGRKENSSIWLISQILAGVLHHHLEQSVVVECVPRNLGFFCCPSYTKGLVPAELIRKLTGQRRHSFGQVRDGDCTGSYVVLGHYLSISLKNASV